MPVTSQDYELSSYNYSENTWNTFNEDTSLIQLTDNSEISSEVPQHSEDSVRNIPVNYSFSINYSPAVRKNSFNSKCLIQFSFKIEHCSNFDYLFSYPIYFPKYFRKSQFNIN